MERSSGKPMMKRIALIAVALLLLASSAFGQGIINGGILGGARIANPNFPTFLQGLQAWYSADQGTYQDAACQFTAADKSWLQITDAAQTGLDIGTDDCLLIEWFYVDGLSVTRSLFDKRSSSATYGIDTYLGTNGSITVRLADTTNAQVTSAAGVVVSGKWYFLAYHADRSGALNAYIGDATTTPTVVATVDIEPKKLSDINSTGAFIVGDNYRQAIPYDGRMDSLMFFKAADLSAVASDIITWAYNSGSGRLCSELDSATRTLWGAVSGWELSESTGTRYDSWGSNHLSQSFANIIQPTTYGDELLTNPGFETAGAGDPDFFGTWLETAGDGAIADEGTLVQAGSHAAKLTAGATANTCITTADLTVSASTAYRLSFWTRGDGTYAGQYGIYNVSASADLTAKTSTTVTGTNYTLRTYDFTTPVGCTSIRVDLWCPATAGGFALYDTVSLSAVTTAALNNGGFESWTVPSAAQLVANPYFTSATTNWTGLRTVLTSEAGGVDGNCLTITNNAETGSHYATSDAITTVAGSVYKLTAYHKNGNKTGKIYIGTGAYGSQLYLGPTIDDADWALKEIYFRATTTTTYITLVNVGSIENDTTLFDSVECQVVPSNADTWTEAVAGSSLIYRADLDSADAATDTVYSGSHALAMQVDATPNKAAIQLASNLTSGKLYSYTIYAKAASGTPAIRVGTATAYTSHTLTTSYVAYSGTFRADATTLEVSCSTASSTVYVDSLTELAAEELPAPGIVRGQSQDSNFATQLNGTSQYYSIADNASLSAGDIEFEVGAWVYLDSKNAHYYPIIAKWSGSGAYAFVLWWDHVTDKFLFCVDNDGSGVRVEVTSASSPNVGQWYFVRGWHDPTANKVYISVNNQAVPDEAVLDGGIYNDAGNFTIGKSSGGINCFGGRIDQPYVKKGISTPTQATALYNNGEGVQWAEIGVAGTALQSWGDDVQGFWEFDIKTALGTDSTSNANNLTPDGTPTQGWGVNYLAGVCSYWQDLSGNGNHGLSSALATRMSYCTNVLNGKPVLCGDGVDDYMTTTLAGLPAATIFFVGTMNAASDVAYGVQDGADANRSYVGSSAADKFAGGVAANADDLITSNDDPGTAFFGSLQYSGDTATVTLYRNGTSEYSAAQSGAVSTALTYTIGAKRTAAAVFDSYLDGQIAEIIVYNRSLPDTERKFIERALSYKWGIAP